MRRRRLVFVLEQTLGHVAHARNLERVVASRPDVDATIARLEFSPAAPWQRLPLLRNWSLRASLAARRALRDALAGGPVDAAFIHTQVAALLAGDLMARLPVVVSLDATPVNIDSLAAGYEHTVRGRWVEAAKAGFSRRALASAAGIVCWNRWAAESLEREYGVCRGRVEVIPPGVDLGLFRPGPRSPTAAGRLRVLFVGGDFERKGGPDLARALSSLAGLAELDIVTARPPASLPGGINCRVHTGLGPQSPALLELYRNADVFALPTLADCLPQVLPEAMASGLAVVSTSVGAIGEVVQDGVTGLVVPPGAPDRLAAALRRLLTDDALRLRLASAGRDLARREHDARRNNSRIVDLLIEAAGRRRPAA